MEYVIAFIIAALIIGVIKKEYQFFTAKPVKPESKPKPMSDALAMAYDNYHRWWDICDEIPDVDRLRATMYEWERSGRTNHAIGQVCVNHPSWQQILVAQDNMSKWQTIINQLEQQEQEQ